MGGIGKSVLARALCEDSEVQATFPDGILWTTLGQEVTPSELLSKLRAWIEALGGIVSETAPTMERLQAILAQRLTERACLLIVDDVWRRRDVEAFQVGGPQCRLLITTRDAEIAAGLGARLQSVNVMAQEEALALLGEWARGHLDVVEDRIKHQIVKRLGYLPLAVRLAGEQLRRHPPEEWLARFDARRLRSSRPESVHDNLFLTFALSLEDLPEPERRCYLALAIFPEDEPIPLAALSRLWGALAGLDDLASRDLLHDLAARALAQLEETDHGPALTLHDLLRDFTADQLGQEGIQNAHRALLDAYRTTQAGAGWSSAPDDGYLYAHLAYHLNALAEHDATILAEIHGLFASDAWLHARVPADDYRYDGYLADLARVWGRVHARALAESAAGKPVRAIAASVHCALIHTTVNTLATNYPPELIARAVQTGLWSAERGMSVLQRVAVPKKQVQMAVSLLATGRLSKKEGVTARRLGLAAARALLHEWDRAEALAALAPHLEGSLLTEALATARAIEYEEERSEALAALAPHLEGSLLTEALAAAHTLDNERYRAEALVALAPHLEGERQQQALTEALAAARTLDNERYRAEALVDLAPRLEGETQRQVLTEALATARAIDDEEYRASTLVALAPHLKGEDQQQVLIEALAAARAIEDEWDQAWVLATLPPHLEGERQQQALTEALAAARAIEDEWDQAWVLATLAPHLEGERQQQALTEALAAARAIEDEWVRARGLATLAPHLEGERQQQALTEALAAARMLEQELYRAKALAALTPHLEDETQQQVLTEALAAARAIKGEWDRAKVLVALVPHLEGEAQQQVLNKVIAAARALELEYEGYRTEALAALAPHLEGTLLTEALAFARTIEDEEYRAKALAALAPHLEGEAQQQVLIEALATARAIEYEEERSEALAVLAPHLQGSLLTEALAAARAIVHEEDRTRALAALAPHLEEETQQQVLIETLAVARAIKDVWGRTGYRARTLTALAPHLEGEVQQQALIQALAAARAIEDEWVRARALAALAPHLKGEDQQQVLIEALAAARAIEVEEYRAYTLAPLVPHLEGNLLNDARAALAECFWDYQHRELLDLFALLLQDDAAFLRAFDLSAEDYARIAQSTVEICTRWEWL
jgi:hypothetical protein